MSSEVKGNLCTNSAEITPDTNINLNIKIHCSYTSRKKAYQTVDTICQFPTGRLCPLIFIHVCIAVHEVHFADLTETSNLRGCYDQGRTSLKGHPATTNLLQGH